MVSMLRPGVSDITTPSDTQLVITRVVEAPRTLVWDAFTKPAMVQKWMMGPPGSTMISEFDARPGGSYKNTFRMEDGSEMAVTGEIREFDPPSRLVSTESWGPNWPEMVQVLEFTEAAGLTTIVMTLNYPSKTARDEAAQSGMSDGMDACYAMLDKLLKDKANG